ncbi:hypothetical protein BT96DRAFT_1001303 [Gymnopus androsaceus JB14]|uniref:Uncharacterized protein n=1 Tax=Gymnopus androsaceus JB14 TaxID=1447944 RepID=A0A6A4H241_9AGAR|nr:hypothetical protein BT96DRAFT_1001303 [Gymnopus androsaceus JB14]
MLNDCLPFSRSSSIPKPKMNVALLDVLQNANAIEILVRILEEQATSPYSTEVSNHIFQTCFNLCRLSKSRQEEAAQAGIMPCLQRVAETQPPLKQFALPILLQDEPSRVQDALIKPEAIHAIINCFVTTKANSFENLLELFLKLTCISTRVTTAFSCSAPFFRRVADRLAHNTKPVVWLNLLRILKSVCEAHPNRGILVERVGRCMFKVSTPSSVSLTLAFAFTLEVTLSLTGGYGQAQISA